MFDKLKQIFRGKRKTMEAQKLTDITRGLQHAASTTNALMAQQYILVINQFFDALPDGTLQAKMVRVAIDEKTYMMVPLISLVTPRGLGLDKMRVRLSVKLEDAKSLEATSEADDSKARRTSFTVSLSPRVDKGEGRRNDVVDLELEFTASNPPEAVMRVIDEYANMVRPVPLSSEATPFPEIKPVKIKPEDTKPQS